MSFDPTWLFLSLFPSGIGFVLLVYVLMMASRERKLKREIAGLKAMLEDRK